MTDVARNKLCVWRWLPQPITATTGPARTPALVGCGRLLSTRGGRRCGSSGTPWSRGSSTRLACRSSTLLCRRRWNSWWISSRIWTLMFLCRSSKYPRSHKILSLSALWTSFRRWRNSWWKCRPYCLLPFSSSGLLSSSLPFLFLVVVMVVFQGLSQDRA